MADRGIGTVLQFGMIAEEPSGSDVPALLDRVSHAIRELGSVDVVDIVFRAAQDGAPAAASVYFVRSD